MSDYIYNNGELYHHGILGQKWGIRRFQNEDGSLTSEGRKRYSRHDINKFNTEMKRLQRVREENTDWGLAREELYGRRDNFEKYARKAARLLSKELGRTEKELYNDIIDEEDENGWAYDQWRKDNQQKLQERNDIAWKAYDEQMRRSAEFGRTWAENQLKFYNPIKINAFITKIDPNVRNSAAAAIDDYLDDLYENGGGGKK